MRAFGSSTGLTLLLADYGSAANSGVAYVGTDFATGTQIGDIRLAALADGTTGNITGTANLVTNGDFATDLSGWTVTTAGSATVVQNAGVAEITGDGTDSGTLDQSITTVVGQTYLLPFTIGANGLIFRVGTTQGGSNLIAGTIVVAGSYLYQFTATTTTTWLQFARTAASMGSVDNVSVQLALPDRSYKSKGLNVVGTLSRTAVATGADLVAVGGFGTGNSLVRIDDADMRFGTGDFAQIGWYDMSSVSNGLRWEKQVDSNNLVRFGVNNQTPLIQMQLRVAGVNNLATYSTAVTGWTQVVFLRRGTALEVWVDGVRAATGTSSFNIDFTGANWNLVHDAGTGSPVLVALHRFTAYAPTPAQIRRMHEDERVLFQTDAKAFLGGTSNAVSDLDYDESRKVLLVGTGDGVSEFSGLRRIGYRDAAGTELTSDTINAVAGAGGFRLMGSSAEAVAHADARNGIDEMNRYGRVERDTDLVARGVTTDATPLNLAPRLHVGEREKITGVVHVTGRMYGAAATQRFSTTLRLSAYRDAGGNVTLDIVADDQKGVLYDTTGTAAIVNTDETTAGMDAALVVDTTPQTIAAQVTGVAATRIVWTARFTDIVRISEGETY